MYKLYTITDNSRVNLSYSFIAVIERCFCRSALKSGNFSGQTVSRIIIPFQVVVSKSAAAPSGSYHRIYLLAS